jgi:Do/DeqQ family serine protease
LLFAQTVTVCMAILFVVMTLRPEWLRKSTPVTVAADQSSSSAQRSLDSGLSNSYAEPVARAAPAVVNVHTTKRIAAPRIILPADPILRRFFEQMPGFNPQQKTTSLGSGVLVSDQGYILTNLHVIDGADEIVVALNDGRQSSAKVIGVDADTDLAVLQINLNALPVMTFAPNDAPRVGDVVLAIGNPFGVGQTITMGIVSALGRGGLGINTYENFIQTDAAINPGNSGGALIDVQGRLIGINTAIYSKSGGSLGIGFAVPARAAQQVLEQIVRDGYVKRGWLGIEPQDMTADLARAFGLEQASGVIIAGMLRDAPAVKGGMKIGDIVQTMDGSVINNTNQLLSRIASTAPGQAIELGVYRGGKKITLNLIAGLRPTRPR